MAKSRDSVLNNKAIQCREVELNYLIQKGRVTYRDHSSLFARQVRSQSGHQDAQSYSMFLKYS